MSDRIKQQAQKNIAQYGLHILHILGDTEGACFTYSIGLYETFGHPEIILLGLKAEVAHSILNAMADVIRDHHSFDSHLFYDDILGGYSCYMLPVEQQHYDAYVGQAVSYYGHTDFPLLQCVYPSVEGVYPWNKNASESLQWFEPLLGQPDITIDLQRLGLSNSPNTAT